MRNNKCYVLKHYKIKTGSRLGITSYTTMNPHSLPTFMKTFKIIKRTFQFCLIICFTNAFIFQTVVWPEWKNYISLSLASRILICFSRSSMGEIQLVLPGSNSTFPFPKFACTGLLLLHSPCFLTSSSALYLSSCL